MAPLTGRLEVFFSWKGERVAYLHATQRSIIFLTDTFFLIQSQLKHKKPYKLDPANPDPLEMTWSENLKQNFENPTKRQEKTITKSANKI